MEKNIGLTKNAGWQFGIRKTFPYSFKYLWDFMFSDDGLKIWLGQLVEGLELKKAYKTQEGVEGVVNTFKPYSHIRMSWKKEEWKNSSILQMRIIGHQDKTTISFHQEKLQDNAQREEMELYWNKKMAEIKNTLQ